MRYFLMCVALLLAGEANACVRLSLADCQNQPRDPYYLPPMDESSERWRIRLEEDMEGYGRLGAEIKPKDGIMAGVEYQITLPELGKLLSGLKF